MNYKDLSKTGVKFYEVDHYDGGIYLNTSECWLVDNNIYIHKIHPNANRYTGRTDTYFYTDTGTKNNLEYDLGSEAAKALKRVLLKREVIAR
jgi:hypothetical protein